MKHYYLLFLFGFLFLTGLVQTTFAGKTIIPIADDGAWSTFSDPSVAYYNGKTYISWITKTGDVHITSYNHTDKTFATSVKVATVQATDFATPSILIRQDGYILLFIPRNEAEAGMPIYRSNSAEDINEWTKITSPAVTSGLGFGTNAVSPFAVGNDLVALYRIKNNTGFVFIKDLAKSGNTTTGIAQGSTTSARKSIISLGLDGADAYKAREELPTFRAVQDADENIHIVFTNNGRGKAYSGSYLHYVKLVITSAVSNSDMSYELYKANGDLIGTTIPLEAPADKIYNVPAGKEAMGYDITLDKSGNPVILYSTYNVGGENDGKEHKYHYAKWNGSDWENSLIDNAGDGLSISNYTAFSQSNVNYTFGNNSYYSGGICFDGNDPSIVYLSKKEAEGTFELYSYKTNDNGTNWTKAETITSNTINGKVNIRPVSFKNATDNFNLLWLQGTYSSPTDFNTSVVTSMEIPTKKVTIPFINDGVWSYNSQPSSVFHNGNTYFTWTSKSGDLMVGSYNHESKDIATATLFSGFGKDDFCSPSILIRASGQILVFASKNIKEGGTTSGYYCFRSTSTTGNIIEGFTSQAQNGYGISSTIPFVIGEDIVVFWRSKNNLGYTFFVGENKASKTDGFAISGGNPVGGTRSGFLGDPGFKNDYYMRNEVPTMRATQDQDGNIHLAITQLGTGLKYDNSTIHYIKATTHSDGNKLSFYTAAGTEASVSYETPSDIVYATSQATDKAIAYDIAIVNGKPSILYDTFTGNNVNAETNPGKTSEHTYTYAYWNGTEWKKSTVLNAGDGLPVEYYVTVEGQAFQANSYYAGGMCFDSNEPSIVYLSKKEAEGTFELYSYKTNDNGTSWTKAKTITSNTTNGKVNIRPVSFKNATDDFNLLWLQGTYLSPTDFNTSIVSLGESAAITSIAFEKDTYRFAVGDIEELKINFYPVVVTDRKVILESGNTNIIEITPDGKINCIGAGTTTITAKASLDESITASCEVVVDALPVFSSFMERIIADIRAEKMPAISQLNQNVTSYLSQLKSNGSFPDINYSATDRTDWAPLKHIDRLLTMGLAYTSSESSFYENDDLKTKMEKMLEYWQNQQPSSNNWYQNEIAEPQRMGAFLILIQYLGKEKITETLFDKSILRMKNKGGNPEKQAGANRIDVALHWMYRACLTKDHTLLQTAMDWIYSPINYTTGAEGIQYDNSYTQHGRQLHIGSYGEVFMDGATKAASYAVGTEYVMPENKLDILSKLVKDSYISTIRGGYIMYNVIGRASTRPGATKKGGFAILDRMISLDPLNENEYNAAIKRITGTESADYEINAKSTHYYKGDYTLHQRKKYSVDLRLVSTRTARNEILADNGEGLKQYFLSDGATGIFMNGDEYYNIYPVWNWAKIPGTTTPEFTTIPKATSYIRAGESNFVGGVTDSLYSVSVYQYKDTYANINSSAKKAWFFFNDEIVCLGNDIKSTAAHKVNTTVNQTLLKGNVVVSSEGSETTLTKGTYDYNNNLDWVYHNGAAYYFPEKGKIQLSAKEQSGSWLDINTSYTQTGTISEDVFTLSFDHGLTPKGEKYEYIIVPGLSDVNEAKAYNKDNIEVIINSDSLQAVYHKELKVFGIVFHRACGFKKYGLTLEADAGCVVLVKDVDQDETIVYVADPQNGANPINIGIETPALETRRLVTYQATAPYLGQSLKFTVNENTPLSSGRDTNLDRSGWKITTSIDGVEDATVGGNVREYIIDDDLGTAFLFVKPGKTFGGISAPSDYIPSFTIDMQEGKDLTYFIYRHRTLGNTQATLRASKVSFYGKNKESDEFSAIVEKVAIATNADIAEVKVRLPQMVNYRYIKLEINEWDTSSGNTIQVSDFNVGSSQILDIEETKKEEDGPSVSIDKINSEKLTVAAYPNPVKRGDIIYLNTSGSLTDYEVEIYDITGKTHYVSNQDRINTSGLSQGMYLLQVKDKTNGRKATTKFIVQ